MNQRGSAATVLWMVIAFAMCPASQGGDIAIPNGSFEAPAVVYVSTVIDDWQKTPKPDGYDESDGFFWSQLTGLFRNTAPGSGDHIDNCEGNQALWLFAVPGVGLFQESASANSSGLPASQALSASFKVGRAYQLSAGVIGMGGGMSNGVTVEIALFYRDAASNQVTVAAVSATNSPGVFSNRTHFVEFRAELPTVSPQDPWANQPLGIRLLSTVGPDLQGGYWDLDNIRLREIRAPAMSAITTTAERFTLQVESEPGLGLEILTTTDPTSSPEDWSHLRTVTNHTGTVSIPNPGPDGSARFYRARGFTVE